MKKGFFTMFLSRWVHSLAGINTPLPQYTLDAVTKTTGVAEPEGLIVPKLTGDQIKARDAQYNNAQKGMLVYATSRVSSVSTKTADITTEGYYSFNGNRWEKLISPSHQDLRFAGCGNHITKDAGVGGTGTNVGGTDCIFIGSNTGFSNAGELNIGIGTNSLRYNTTGCSNTAIGALSMQANTTGGENTVMGYVALYNNIKGSENTAIGSWALFNNVTGSKNTAVGVMAGGAGNSVGDHNTFVGHNAGFFSTGHNNIAIGASSDISFEAVNNEVTLGNLNNNSYRMFAASWTNASDKKLKHSIAPLRAGLDFLMSLKPSEYVYNNEEKEIKTMGFIAQDIQESLKKFGMEGYKLVNNLNSQYLGLNTGELIPVLAKAIQEQQKIIQKLQKEMEEMKM